MALRAVVAVVAVVGGTPVRFGFVLAVSQHLVHDRHFNLVVLFNTSNYMPSKPPEK